MFFKMLLKTMKILFFILSVSCIVSAMEDMAKSSEPVEDNSILLEPLLDFTSRLFQVARDDKKNAVMSPMSIATALNLVLLGAEPGSATQKEMLDALGYTSQSISAEQANEAYARLLPALKQDPPNKDDRRAPSLDIWNLLISRNLDPLPQYSEEARKFYNCSVVKNSESAKENQDLVDSVNDWAKEAGFDGQILKESDLTASSQSIFIINAVKVQGYWFERFALYEAEDVFYNYGLADQNVSSKALGTSGYEDTKYVEFMNVEKTYAPSVTERIRAVDQKAFDELALVNFRAVQIPLIGGLTYTIFEPVNNGTGKELAEMEKHLLADGRLAKALKLIDSREAEAYIDHLQMPPYKFQQNLNLKNIIRTLGIKRATDPSNSQLDRITSEPTYIEDIKHDANIEVDRFGLKAAAITVGKIVPLAGFFNPNKLRIKIAYPHMFMVRYGKVPMFIGHLVHL